jgi:hypothetical protein
MGARIFWLSWLLAAATALGAAPCLDATPHCREFFRVGDADATIYRTFSLQAPAPEVTEAIIVVHGVLRNADTYFQTMVEATRLADRLPTTLVIAPHFKAGQDAAGPHEPRWSPGGWKRGDLSLKDRARPVVSSFTVVDALLRTLSDRARFPALRRVVVTGHSAGGQFLSRYAAGNLIEAQLKGLAVDYIVANPSSWLYLDPVRPIPGKPGQFIEPTTTCPYDLYPYGLRERNEYLKALSETEMREQFASRHVTIFLGEADTETEDLDMDCEAMLQGPHRYGRGLAYFTYLRARYPLGLWSLTTVAGVGHSAERMYQSPSGLDLLFKH